MGITKRTELVWIKLLLPAALALELREVRELAERAGYEFSLISEIGAALAAIRAQLPPADRPTASKAVHEGDSTEE